MKRIFIGILLLCSAWYFIAAQNVAIFRTVISGVTALTQDSTAVVDIGSFKFFSLQIQVTGTTVDIDSIIWECSNGLIGNFDEFTRCPDRNGSVPEIAPDKGRGYLRNWQRPGPNPPAVRPVLRWAIPSLQRALYSQGKARMRRARYRFVYWR